MDMYFKEKKLFEKLKGSIFAFYLGKQNIWVIETFIRQTGIQLRLNMVGKFYGKKHEKLTSLS